MRKYIRRNSGSSFASVAFVLTAAMAVMFTAGCGSKADQPPATPRDVALAPPPTPVVQPPIQDAPPPSPVVQPPVVQPPPPSHRVPRPRPRPVPVETPPVAPPATTIVPPVVAPPVAEAPAPRFGFIAAGTDFAVRPSAKVCTDTKKVGDRFVATVAESVGGSDGAVIPAGATATLEVVESQPGINDASKVAFGFRVTSIVLDGETYEVHGGDVVAPPVSKVRRQSNGDQAKKVAAGAVIGAIAGRILGKGTRSTVIGGAAGAAGGAVVAAKTADYDGCVDADARLTVRLSKELRIRVGN